MTVVIRRLVRTEYELKLAIGPELNRGRVQRAETCPGARYQLCEFSGITGDATVAGFKNHILWRDRLAM